MMVSVPMMATDIYLPALPAMTHFFQASIADLQLTLSVYFLGRVVAFLIYGPLIDRFGYWRVSLFCIASFILATIICVISPTLPVLIIARFFQAAFIGAGSVIGRASVGYYFDKKKAIQTILITSPFALVSAGIAPIIGGYSAQYLGWRNPFIFMVIFGLVMFILVFKYFRIDSTRLIEKRHGLNFRQMVNQYVIVMKNVQFIRYLSVSVGVFAIYYGFLTESPFIFDRLGFSASHMSYFYLFLAIAYLIGSFTGRTYIKKVGSERIFQITLGILFLSILSLIVLPLFNIHPLLSFLVSILTMSLANGVLNPLSIISGIALFPESEGTASGLIGLFPMLAAAFSAKFIHIWTQGHLLLMGIFMMTIVLIMMGAYFGLAKFPYRTR